jgi:glycyl-tRNA synthetase alpha subunit
MLDDYQTTLIFYRNFINTMQENNKNISNGVMLNAYQIVLEKNLIVNMLD